MDERKYWVWLSMCLGQGSSHAGQVIDYFGSAQGAYESGNEEMAKCLKKDVPHTIKMMTKYSVEQAGDIVDWCDKHHVRILTFYDDDYPKAIKHQVNLPLVLYAVGKIPPWNTNFSCAVVGTRKMTDYGKETSFDFGYELAAGGAIVVSGMAIGVDGMAMAGAISAGGHTVAVLGCGIDICYPSAHRRLMQEVIKNGIVITEYPPQTPPTGTNFPIRNRIISGISQATVVVEGDDNSGALITANHAIYQGKSVFAVPGKVTDESSNGPNSLIKRGIPAVTEAFDVLIEYEQIFSNCINTSRLRRKYLTKRKDEYLDVAERLHVVSSLDREKGYYGQGLYGGRNSAFNNENTADGESKKKNSEKNTDIKKKSKPEARPEKAQTQDKAPVKISAKDTVQKIAQNQANDTKVPEKFRPKSTQFLSDQYLGIYNIMKPDVPTLPDELCILGFGISEVLVAMTMLEISGLVEASPGGYFTRLGAEDLTMALIQE